MMTSHPPRIGVLLLSSIFCASLVAELCVAGDSTSKEEKKAFEALVKAIGSERGGYVHPSLGIMSPCPSGAPRGIGMVKDVKKKQRDDDVLIKVPFSYQMTRHLALSTMTSLIPVNVLREAPLVELDDAALLVLLLAHERGLGKKSKFRAFINTLPNDGGCGWATATDFRKLPPSVDVEDIEGATMYAHRVANGMANDYAVYLAKQDWPATWKDDPAQALLWSLCTVSSRGTAANLVPGDASNSGIRLVPLADMSNHQVVSGGFIELSGTEQRSSGDFMDADANDAGAFVVRSTWRDGSTNELSKGDEVTVNYNLPQFAAVDWFLSLGFVPPELSSHDEL